jgi:hypothetical protein
MHAEDCFSINGNTKWIKNVKQTKYTQYSDEYCDEYDHC